MIYLFSFLTIFAFWAGQKISKKLRSNILNPFLLALIIVVTLLYFIDIPYKTYHQGNFPLNNLLSVSVVALALPFYEQLPQIRKKWKPIMAVLFFSTFVAMLTGVLFAVFLGAQQEILTTIIPKSVSTPIAIAIAGQIGGNSAITAVGVMIAGLIGSAFGFSILHWLGVRNVRAIGLTMGSVSHALGTGRCMEYSVKTGSYSSIALVVCGVLSSIFAPMMYKLAMWFFY